MSGYGPYPALAITAQIIFTIGLVTYTISLIGGWFWLGRRYKTERPMTKGSFLVSGSFRHIASYQNVIRAGADAEGLYLRFWPRLAHPPLFIPWQDIKIKQSYRFIFRMQTLVLGKTPWVPFTVSERHVQRLLAMRDQDQTPKVYAIGGDGPITLSS